MSTCANSFASRAICDWITSSASAGGLSNHRRSSQSNREISPASLLYIAEKHGGNVVSAEPQFPDHLAQMVDRRPMRMGGENANVRFLEVAPEEIGDVAILRDLLLIAPVHCPEFCDATRHSRMGYAG